ncbi:hypothetical protein [Nocardia rhizosphaerae]|uniref:Uncharacterized protein n=1 Tax=Nocardia rhizosphaerae TaxID=1691571 RepID=A0ABV8LCL0_9NOCA
MVGESENGRSDVAETACEIILHRLELAAQQCAESGIPFPLVWAAAEEGLSAGHEELVNDPQQRMRLSIAERVCRGYGSVPGDPGAHATEAERH